MKRILISMLAVAALAACSKSETGDNGGGLNPDGTAPIVLSAGIPTAAVTPGSKAPIVPSSTFDAAVAGWESNSGVPTYSGEPKWQSAANNISANSTAQTITLTPTQAYNADNTVKTYMKAWYPKGTATATWDGKITFANTDGSVDAMLAPVINGSKNDAANKELAFAHKTTQLKFKVVGAATLVAGTTLTSIKVKNAQLPTGFDLATDAVTYAAAADLTVSGISNLAIPITPAEAAVAGSPVMIQPMTGNTVKLDIVTNNATYTDVTATIDDDTNFAMGKAYTITLTFGQKSVDLKASVADWTTGTGTGNVE